MLKRAAAVADLYLLRLVTQELLAERANEAKPDTIEINSKDLELVCQGLLKARKKLEKLR